MVKLPQSLSEALTVGEDHEHSHLQGVVTTSIVHCPSQTTAQLHQVEVAHRWMPEVQGHAITRQIKHRTVHVVALVQDRHTPMTYLHDQPKPCALHLLDLNAVLGPFKTPQGLLLDTRMRVMDA